MQFIKLRAGIQWEASADAQRDTSHTIISIILLLISTDPHGRNFLGTLVAACSFLSFNNFT